MTTLERIRRLEASHRAVIRGMCAILRDFDNFNNKQFRERLARELDKEHDKFDMFRAEGLE